MLTVHFSANQSGEWPRDKVRAVFGLIDNALQALSEPAEVSIPVNLPIFAGLYERAQTILRGEEPTRWRQTKTSDFLLYNFGGTIEDVVARFIDTPLFDSLAENWPDEAATVVLSADRVDMLDIVLRLRGVEGTISRILDCRARKCLAVCAEKYDVEQSLVDPRVGDMYKPLVLHSPESVLCAYLYDSPPKATKYVWDFGNITEETRDRYAGKFLRASILLDDAEFAAEVLKYGTVHLSWSATDEIQSANMLELLRECVLNPDLYRRTERRIERQGRNMAAVAAEL